MVNTVLITVLALGGQALAEESIDKSIDALFDRFPTVPSLQETTADLDNTMLGKTVQAGHLAIPSSRSLPSSPARAPPSAYRVPIPSVAARATSTGSQRQAVPVMAPYARGSGVSERESTQQQVEEEPAAKTEATLADVLEAKAKAKRAAAAAKPPYDIKLFVKGDMANYPHDYERLVEHKIEDALANYQDHISAVDVRMVAEGHRPLLYRFEVTAKSDMPGATIVSKSKHAHPTFPEAIDDLHDTLKRNVRKQKETRIDKKRSGKVQNEKEFLNAPDPSEVIEEAGDEEYDFEMKGARQEP